jgi:hypothetical protein
MKGITNKISSTAPVWTLLLAAGILLAGTTRAAERPPVDLAPNHFDILAYPGDEISHVSTFQNGLDIPLSLHISSADFVPKGEEGAVEVGKAPESVHSLKEWIKPSLERLDVPPHASVPIPFAVPIPRYALPGSRWGALIATASFLDQNGTLTRVEVSANILLRIRGDAPETEENVVVEGFGVSKRSPPQALAFEARFRNTGTVHVKPKGAIEVRNLWGTEVARVELPEQNVIPGVVRKAEAFLDRKLPIGRYTARLDATYGLAEKRLSAETRFWILPQHPIRLTLLIAAGLMAILAALVARRRVNSARLIRITRESHRE